MDKEIKQITPGIPFLHPGSPQRIEQMRNARHELGTIQCRQQALGHGPEDQTRLTLTDKLLGLGFEQGETVECEMRNAESSSLRTSSW